MRTSTAIVIGGGPAGLLAAARLAERGVATTVVEARTRLGGRAGTVRRGGLDLNQGPHALHAGGAAIRELRALGLALPLWNPASWRSVAVRDGGVRRAPRGAVAVAALAARLLRDADPAGPGRRSARAWIDHATASPDGRLLAAALVRLSTFVADLDRLDATVAVYQLRRVLHPGVRYVHGGWQTLVDGLAAAATRRGAVLRTHAPARAIERERQGWSVIADGEPLTADVVVVATGGPAAAAALLGDRSPAPPGPPARISVLDVGLERLPRRDRRFALGVDAPTYLSQHSPPGAPGPALMTAAGYAGQPRGELEATLDAVQPGWRGRATFARFLPRMTAVGAIVPAGVGGLRARPSTIVGDGLFVAGDWVGPEGWLLDAALSSAAGAACAALAHRPRMLA